MKGAAKPAVLLPVLSGMKDLARSAGIGEPHPENGGCWFLKLIGSFQGEGCRWSANCDEEEEVKSMHVHAAIVDPGCWWMALS